MNQEFIKINKNTYAVTDGNLKIVNSELSESDFGDILFNENKVERLESEYSILKRRHSNITYGEKWRKIIKALLYITLGIGAITYMLFSIPVVVSLVVTSFLCLFGSLMGTKRGNNKKRKIIETRLESIENEIEVLKKELQITKQNVKLEEINPRTSIDQQAQDYNVGSILEVDTIERQKVKILSYNKNDLPK